MPCSDNKEGGGLSECRYVFFTEGRFVQVMLTVMIMSKEVVHQNVNVFSKVTDSRLSHRITDTMFTLEVEQNTKLM